MSETEPRGGPEWDAFLSYSRRDQAKAALIHAFLQTYHLPGGRKRLRIFRDTTDLIARNLTDALPGALSRASTLLVCCSPGARASGWVGREIEAFQSTHGAAARVTPLLLEGELADALPTALAEAEPLVLDLRQDWRLGRPGPATRLELLRAVAAIADIPLRDLVPWDLALRRRRLILGGGLAAAVLAIVAVTGTGWWVQSATAQTTAMRRRADSALLQLGAGDVPRAVANLGYVLARSRPEIAGDYGEVLRFWLHRLTDAREVADEASRQPNGELLHFNGRSFLPDGVELPLDEPFEVVRDAGGRLLAAGREEMALFAMPGLRPLLRQTFPARLEPTDFAAAPERGALVVAAKQLETTNDEDKPTERPACRVIVMPDGARATAQAEAGFRLRLRGEGGALLATDCQVGLDEPPEETTNAGEKSPVERLEASWLPEHGLDGPGLVSLKPLPRHEFPRLREEVAGWRQEKGEPPNFIHGGKRLDPLYVRLLPRLAEPQVENADLIDFDGFDGCYNACGVFPVDGGHILWSFHITGNSFATLAACRIGAHGTPGRCSNLREFLTLNSAFAAAPDGRTLARSSRHRGDPPLSLHVVEQEGREREIRLERLPTGEVVNLAFALSSRLMALTTNDEIWVYAIYQAQARLERRIRLGLPVAGLEAACRHVVHQDDKSLRTLPLLEAGGLVIAVDSQCGMIGADLSTGDLRWRVRLPVPPADARLELLGAPGATVFAVRSGNNFRLFQARTGTPISDEVALATLMPGVEASGLLIDVALSGEVRLRAPDGRLAIRAAPPTLTEMREKLNRLHALTGISVADGATPLAKPPLER